MSLLDASGTWVYRERPRDPKSKPEVKPMYRVVWAVVTVGDETAHVRLSGSDKVVGKHYDEFVAWLKGIK